MDSVSAHPESQTIITDTPSDEESSVFAKIGWMIFGVLCLLFFTLLKLPEHKINAHIQSWIGRELSKSGMTLTAESSSLSFFPSPSYVLKNASLSMPGSNSPLRWDELAIRPALGSILSGKLGANLVIKSGKGGAKGVFLASPSQAGLGEVQFSLEATDLDFGKAGVFEAFAGVQTQGLLSGKIDLQGGFDNLTSLSGTLLLNLKNLALPKQSVMGFNLPDLQLTGGEIDLMLQKGKLAIKKLQLGASEKDDLFGNLGGEVLLGRTFQESSLNLKTRFKLSERVLTDPSLSLLGAFMGTAKKPDGYFAYLINGPASFPNAGPDPN